MTTEEILEAVERWQKMNKFEAAEELLLLLHRTTMQAIESFSEELKAVKS